ncbi:diiron oxygenase [Streptomyces hirsutus]
MTDAQRKALTRQEAASVASTGIWFEMILQQMVLRDIYAKDPTDDTVQWALTEIADECRHSIMFARGAKKLLGTGLPPPPGSGRTRPDLQDRRVR